MPLLPHMLLSAFSVQRVRTTSTMCALPFLRHAIWQRRISRVLQGLGAVSARCLQRCLRCGGVKPWGEASHAAAGWALVCTR